MIRVRSSGGWQTFTPSEFTYGLQDISASDSGRTQDGLMHKNRITQKVKLNLGFWGLRPEETARLLQAFNPEYVEVEYPDAMSGHNEIRTFYTGDKTAPVEMWVVNNKAYSKISFNIIER